MDKNNNAVWEKYSKTTHFIGRLVSAITVIMLVGAPFLIGKYLGAFPDIGAVGKAFFSVGLVWTVSSVAEFLIYTPMLGSGGGYLAFITGNLINMKIPCAVTARDMVGVKSGTKENNFNAFNCNLVPCDDSCACGRCARAYSASAAAPKPDASACV